MTEPKPEFVPYKAPEHIDITVLNPRHGWGVLYHFLALAWWSYKRERANDKMCKHGTFLEHETIVTEFNEKLDDGDPE